ncbi:hypothetical protein Droror1_Dr00007906 [Drosera rotundifolia]
MAGACACERLIELQTYLVNEFIYCTHCCNSSISLAAIPYEAGDRHHGIWATSMQGVVVLGAKKAVGMQLRPMGAVASAKLFAISGSVSRKEISGLRRARSALSAGKLGVGIDATKQLCGSRRCIQESALNRT